MFENPLVKKCSRCNYVSNVPIDDFYADKKSKDKLAHICKKCSKNTSKLWKKNNKEKNKKRDHIYINKKIPFLMENYSGKWSKYRVKAKILDEEKLKKYQIYYTKEMFLEMVKEYEEKNGFVCEITGVPLTTTRANKGKIGGKRTYTNFSMDRLDPAIGYTKQNTIFVTWEFNDRKGAVTPKYCFLILKKYKERFPDEFNEFMKEFGEVFK